MSLVAYGSSDESDSEDPTESGAGPGRGAKTTGLFSSLPTPKNATPGSSGPSRSGPNWGASFPPPRDSAGRIGVLQGPEPAPPNQPPPRPEWSQENDPEIPSFQPPSRAGLSLPSPSGGLVFNLPKPKKRTEPVKIRIPEIERGASDSDEDEPVRKKSGPQGSGGGLSSLLPQPRNLVAKEMNRALVPHTLTKRQPEPKAPARPASGPAAPAASVSASPSAIKAAAKSATLQLARQMAQEEEDEEEGSDGELAPENYFSLPDSSQPGLASVPPPPPPPGTEAAFQSDAPLDFGSAPLGPAGLGAWEGQEQAETYYPQYQDPDSRIQGPAQESYYQVRVGGVGGSTAAFQAVDPGSIPALTDVFRRLQGKRNQGKEEVKFLEIKGDDQLSGSQQWLTKAITEEKDQRKSFSKKKGDQPTGQQRRKHQITYLIHQAKERELELKNSWADNKLTRRQTQAKYGF
nr:PREDICTED: proline-rich protein PRCC [Lepisosteus oculatus]